MMDKVHRPQKPKKEDLKKVYDVFNEVIRNRECYYTDKELKKIAKEKIAL